jgi:hypothetical protein
VARSPCAIPRQRFDERDHKYREIVARVSKDFPNVQVFDAAAPFCDAQWCWAMKNGTLLYRDDRHISLAGSEYIAQQLALLVIK